MSDNAGGRGTGCAAAGLCDRPGIIGREFGDDHAVPVTDIEDRAVHLRIDQARHQGGCEAGMFRELGEHPHISLGLADARNEALLC